MFNNWALAIARIFEFLTQVTKRRRVADQIRRVIYIYEWMKWLLVNAEGVERVLVWRASNGKGKILPGVPIYISVVYEDFQPIAFPGGSVKSQYQGLLVDKEYLNLLIEMLEKKSITVDPRDLPDDSMMGELYAKDGIKYGEIHWLHNDDKSVYYVSIGTTQYHEGFQSHRAAIAVAVDHMRNAMSGKKLST